ncbi:MAG: response regulator transcription factor [Thermaurantiacus sp.]
MLAHLTSKEIARELGISPHTVDGHLRGALQRLGLQSRIEAALLLAAVEDRFPQPRHGLAGPTHVAAAAGAAGAGPVQYICSEPFADLHYADMNATDRERERNITYTSGHREQELPGDWREIKDSEIRNAGFQHIRKNGLDAGQRLLVVVLVSLGSAVMFAALVVGISTLSNFWS